MNRNKQIAAIANELEWDFLVIGGGASGLGCAVDASNRGFKTVLLEAYDFSKGTSSRSTKLVHGGVRYLAQGDVALVKEALEERGLLARNAKHLFKNQKFIIPNYSWWGGYYYALGMKMYDFLSKKLSLGKSRLIDKNETISNIPAIKDEKLVSGVSYQDGQFDDSRLAINLAQTAIKQGAVVVNYMKVIGLLKNDQGKVIGVEAEDQETSKIYRIKSKVIVNATGIFTNEILDLNDASHGKTVVPSQGVHLVLDRSFLKSDDALMIPKTSDGRVLFAVPWHDKVILGTTDTLIKDVSFEPKALEEEIEFILKTADHYLKTNPQRKDILSVFAGLRPLAAPKKEGMNTKEVSRSHKIVVSDTNLITIIGGKWTTYRKMAEEIIDTGIRVHKLPNKKCATRDLAIHGNVKEKVEDFTNHYYFYGSDWSQIKKLESEKEEYQQKVHPNYDYTMAQVVWSIREEMARTVEDILARRIRLLFLDAKAAMEAAPKVAEILAKELEKSKEWAEEQEQLFLKLAQNYLLK